MRNLHCCVLFMLMSAVPSAQTHTHSTCGKGLTLHANTHASLGISPMAAPAAALTVSGEPSLLAYSHQSTGHIKEAFSVPQARAPESKSLSQQQQQQQQQRMQKSHPAKLSLNPHNRVKDNKIVLVATCGPCLLLYSL